MSRQQKISTPRITVNGDTFAIVPNTTEFTLGYGSSKMETESIGGGSVQVVVSQNAENNFSVVKFTINTYESNITALQVFKDNNSRGVLQFIEIVNPPTGTTYNFNNCVFVGDPSIKLSADGNIEVEFNGTRPPTGISTTGLI